MDVLVAEDDPLQREVVASLLRQWGYEVAVVPDGSAAWGWLEAHQGPALALLDWNMPGLEGPEVCRRLREDLTARPFYLILLTARGSQEDLLTGLQAGADDYVTKPVNWQELHARVGVGERLLNLQTQIAAQAAALEVERREGSHFRALALERERFEAAVSEMSDGIVVMNQDLCATYANRAAELLLNIRAESALSLPVERLLEPFQISLSTADLHEAPPGATAFEIARNTHPALYMEACLTRLVDPAGVPAGAVLSVRDVTTQRQQHHVRSTFFNLISHKLRTPLTLIGGYLKLAEQFRPEEMAEQMPMVLEVCRSETAELEQLVDELLELKNLNGAGLEITQEISSVPEAIAAAVCAARSAHPTRQVEFTTNVAPGAEKSCIGTRHLDRALCNLLENAIKFGDKEPVTIRIDVARDKDGLLCLQVADNGPGIPHEYYDRILEGFVQVEDTLTGQVPGLGVGLFVARQIVKAYGGDVSIYSKIGEGSAITLRIPGDRWCDENN